MATPAGAIEMSPPAEKVLLPFHYAQAREKPVAVYPSPGDPAAQTPVEYLLPPDSWVSIDETLEVKGRLWYRVDETAYVLASDVLPASPSTFHGTQLAEEPQHPPAFIIVPSLNIRARPGATPDNPAVGILSRYDMINILSSQEVEDGIWYQIGDDQYIHSAYVRVVHPVTRPGEIGPDERWISVDLVQQTMAAYEGDRMVFATLVSTGRPPWFTPKGLYRVWIKLATGNMQGGIVERGDYYYIQDVPWIMYFSRDVGLHGAFWHDRFGFPSSHGCVNLSPLDADWLFQWATPLLPRPDQKTVYASKNNPGTWVHVYASGWPE